MRKGRERLIEWLGDMLFEQSGMDVSEYPDVIASYQGAAAPWADRIMEDIRLGIIKGEDQEHCG